MTNGSMLKILCPEKEEHLKLICSNCQKAMISRQPKEKAMSVTRRELFSMFPAMLIPAIHPREYPAIPSTVYPFQNMPIPPPNNAHIRHVLTRNLTTVA